MKIYFFPRISKLSLGNYNYIIIYLRIYVIYENDRMISY